MSRALHTNGVAAPSNGIEHTAAAAAAASTPAAAAAASFYVAPLVSSPAGGLLCDRLALQSQPFTVQITSPAALRLHGFGEDAQDKKQIDDSLLLYRALRTMLASSGQTLAAHQLDKTLNVFFDRAYFLSLLSYAPFIVEANSYWCACMKLMARVAQENGAEAKSRALVAWQKLHWWIIFLQLGAIMRQPRTFDAPVGVKPEAKGDATVAAAAATAAPLPASTPACTMAELDTACPVRAFYDENVKPWLLPKAGVDEQLTSLVQAINGRVEQAVPMRAISQQMYDTALQQITQMLDALMPYLPPTPPERSNPTTMEIIVPSMAAVAGDEHKQEPAADRVVTYRNWTGRSDGSYDVDDNRFREPQVAQSQPHAAHPMAAAAAAVPSAPPPSAQPAAASSSTPSSAASSPLRVGLPPVAASTGPRNVIIPMEPDSDDEEDASMAAATAPQEEQKEPSAAQIRPDAPASISASHLSVAHQAHAAANWAATSPNPLWAAAAGVSPFSFSGTFQQPPFAPLSVPAVTLPPPRPSMPAAPSISRPTPPALVGPGGGFKCPEANCPKRTEFPTPTQYDHHWRRAHTMDFVCTDATCSVCLKKKGSKPATFGSAADLQKHRSYAEKQRTAGASPIAAAASGGSGTGSPLPALLPFNQGSPRPAPMSTAAAAATPSAGFAAPAARPTPGSASSSPSVTSPRLPPQSQSRADDLMVDEEDMNGSEHTPGSVSASFAAASAASPAVPAAAAIAAAAQTSPSAPISPSIEAEFPVPLMAPQLSQVDEGDEDAGDDATSATKSEPDVAPSAPLQTTPPVAVPPTSNAHSSPIVQADLSSATANEVSSPPAPLAAASAASAAPAAPSSDMDVSDAAVEAAEPTLPSSTTSSSSSAAAAVESAVHIGVRCDGCKQEPIRGNRYRCSDCPVNLCELCQLAGTKHSQDHSTIQIREAVDSTATSLANVAAKPPSLPVGATTPLVLTTAAAPTSIAEPSESAAPTSASMEGVHSATAAISPTPAAATSVAASAPTIAGTAPTPAAGSSTRTSVTAPLKPASTLHVPASSARPTSPPAKTAHAPPARSTPAAPVTPPSPTEVKRQQARKSRAEIGADGLPVPRPASATPMLSTLKLPPAAAKPAAPVPSAPTTAAAAAAATSPSLAPKPRPGVISPAPVIESDLHKLADAHREATQPKDPQPTVAEEAALSALNQHAADSLSAPMSEPVTTPITPAAAAASDVVVPLAAPTPDAVAPASPARPPIAVAPASPPLSLSFATLPPFQTRKQREGKEAQKETDESTGGASPPSAGAAAVADVAAPPQAVVTDEAPVTADQQPAPPSSASASNSSAAAPSVSAVHIGVSCDGCKVNPIRGNRYACLQCRRPPGFDLCEQCEQTGATHHRHSLIKLSIAAIGTSNAALRKTQQAQGDKFADCSAGSDKLAADAAEPAEQSANESDAQAVSQHPIESAAKEAQVTQQEATAIRDKLATSVAQPDPVHSEFALPSALLQPAATVSSDPTVNPPMDPTAVASASREKSRKKAKSKHRAESEDDLAAEAASLLAARDPTTESTPARKRARTNRTEAAAAAATNGDASDEEEAAAMIDADLLADAATGDSAPAAATAAVPASEFAVPAAAAGAASPKTPARSQPAKASPAPAFNKRSRAAAEPTGSAPPSPALTPATPPSASKSAAAVSPASTGAAIEDAIDLTADDSPDYPALRPRRAAAKPKKSAAHSRSKIPARKRAAAAAADSEERKAASEDEDDEELKRALAVSLVESSSSPHSPSSAAAASALHLSAPSEAAAAAVASGAPSSPASRPAAAAASKANKSSGTKRKLASAADAPEDGAEERKEEQQTAAPRTPAKKASNRASLPVSASAARSPAVAAAAASSSSSAAAAAASSPPLASGAATGSSAPPKPHAKKKARVDPDDVEETTQDDLLAELTRDVIPRSDHSGAASKQTQQQRDNRPPSPSDDSIEY